MWPLLRPGDLVVIDPVDRAHRPGSILAYRSGGCVVIHRLLRQDDLTLVLAGDNCSQADQPVQRGALLGRVIEVQSDGQSFSLRSGSAEAVGWLLATCNPLRRRRGLRRVVAWLHYRYAQRLRP